MEFNSVMDEKNVSVGELENAFWEALRSTFEHIVGAMQKLGSPSNDHVHPDKLGQITSWEKVFDSFLKNLSLDDLRNKLLRTIFYAVSFVIFIYFLFFTCV